MSYPRGRAASGSGVLGLIDPILILGAVLYATGCGIALARGAHSFFPAWAGIAALVRVVALLALGIWALRRRSLTFWIFWSMFAGVEIGADAPALALRLHVFSELFLRLIEAIVAPLILGTLITGIAAHGDSREVSRLSVKSLIYFEVLTTIALAVGLAAINISHAGVTESVPKAAYGRTAAVQTAPMDWAQFLLHATPDNLAKSIADNEILQVTVFAVLFGLALGKLSEGKRAPMLAVLRSLASTMFEFTRLIMYLAPLAVGASLAYAVAHSGFAVMFSLGKLVLTLYAAIAIFALVGLLPAALIARVPLGRFLAAAAEPTTIAFATSASEAALPIAMERMEKLGVPGKIAGFVIPAGYSFNLAGSALYLPLAAVFVAQSSGIHLNWKKQLMMMATLMLTSKGVAGVPRAVLIVLMATAASFQLPADAIAALLGVDALMDMGRTAVNVLGNCLASVVIAKWEGEFVLSSDPLLRESSVLSP